MLRKLANMFVDLGPEQTQSKPVQASVPAITPAQGTAPRVSIPVQPAVQFIAPGQPDPEILKILEESIQEANIPGFDYLEFRDVLANMASIQMPEAQKFQAAFASAQVSKITKQQLLEAIDFYIKVVNTKGEEWANFVAGQIATEVEGKNQQIADIDSQVEVAAAKIAELTKTINELRQKQDKIRMDQTQADLDIKNKSASFEATKSAVLNRLTSDRTKIESYIQ